MPSDAAKKRAQQKKATAFSKRSQPEQKPTPTATATLPNQDITCTTAKLVFPPTLTSRQRAVLHEVAESAGISHVSKGDADQRHIVLGSEGAPEVKISATSTTLSDDEICDLLQTHLSISATSAFAQPAASAPSRPSAHSNSVSNSGSSRAPTQPSSGRSGVSRPSAQSGGPQGGVVDVGEWVQRMRGLLDMEQAAEVAQSQEAASVCDPELAQARGRTLLNLRLADSSGGLLGSTLLTLVSNKGWGGGTAPYPPLPVHKFGPHDVVALKASKGEGGELCQGLVYRVTEGSLVVAVDDPPEDGLEQPLRVEKLANEVTWQRLRKTLSCLSNPMALQQQQHPGERLVDVVFGRRPPKFAQQPPKWQPTNRGLDASQREAIETALMAQDVALIHGPPGTGKTTAVVELILQEVGRGSRVLAASASNIAVDNLVERLARAAPKLRVVRMGHPARLLPEVLNNSLEAHVLRADSSALARDCRAEMKDLNQQLGKLGGRERQQRRELRGRLKQLGKEERSRQAAAVKEVIKGAHVLCATLTGVLHHSLQEVTVDVVVVDEAAQALEVATWGALLKGRKAVLAGDHLQLPPTVLSDAASQQGLSVTLFERLHHLWGGLSSRMLTVQYRMNSAIMDWSSQELYEGKLSAHESVASHTLEELESGLSEMGVLVLLDTTGCDMEEKMEEGGESRMNEGEAKVVMAHVGRLISSGLPATSIGVITPYSAQVRLLRELRPDKWKAVEISTVDGFQGREKEAIVISMVRSSSGGEVGFLADSRRMNVAITRARRHCALVCDSETVSHDPFLKRLVQYFETHAEYLSAAELVS